MSRTETLTALRVLTHHRTIQRLALLLLLVGAVQLGEPDPIFRLVGRVLLGILLGLLIHTVWQNAFLAAVQLLVGLAGDGGEGGGVRNDRKRGLYGTARRGLRR